MWSIHYQRSKAANIIYFLLMLLLFCSTTYAQQTYNLQVIWQKTASANVDVFGYSPSSGDLNGDGFSDIVIRGDSIYGGDTWICKAYIYYGGTTFDTIPDLIVVRPESTGFMIAICVKDINN
ncbi:MAG: FG-GAP repeat protein, partial [candidate division WOR-3 bacterium]